MSAGSYNNQTIATSIYMTINNRGEDTTKNITNKNEFKYLFELMKRKPTPNISEKDVFDNFFI